MDAPYLGKGRVLVVDDDPEITAVFERILADDGFDVVAVLDGNIALQRASEHFDAVLCDIRMPRIDGLELLRKLREVDQHVPVILMTGGPTAETAARAAIYGAVRYLTKPIRPSQLVAVVQQAVRQHRLAEQPPETGRVHGLRDGLAGGPALEATLRRALQSLWLAYQPILRTTGYTAHGQGQVQATLGYQAMLRCDEPSLTHPGELVDLALRLGSIATLDQAVLVRVADAMRVVAGTHRFFVGVHPDNPLGATWERPPLSTRLVLEVPCKARLEGLVPRTQRLQREGLAVALEGCAADIGEDLWKALAPAYVKIDPALLHAAEGELSRRGDLRALVALAHGRRAEVIATGVESASEHHVAAEVGCDWVQGSFHARPEPISAQAMR